MSKIDKTLIEHIKAKNVVLFLGSGFAYNAIHSENQQPPIGQGLSNMISEKFLGGAFNNEPLTIVSEMAISGDSLFNVQLFVANIFNQFSPNESHVKYASLPWKAIFTTNYDLILEQAYRKNSKTVQELSPVFRNTPVQQIFKSPNSVPYYKLHGCISYINDQNLPLILSTDQYITHKENRDRLFSKLYELAMDHPILFIGYSNQDMNIRTILKELEVLKDAKPRSYMVKPNFRSEEISFWEGKKIKAIDMGHEEFIKALDGEISDVEKKLSSVKPEVARPIYTKFQVSIDDLTPTESLINLLDYEIEFVHSGMSSKDTPPQAFYKGSFRNWDPIIKNLDVQRAEKDRILTHLIFEDRYQDNEKSYLFVIKGHAGSGKSVLLKRLAWDTAVEFEKTCFFVDQAISLRPEPFIELHSYIKDRIYIFVNNVSENEKAILQLLDSAAKEKIPLTIISTERTNIWNEDLLIKNYVSDEFSLSYLSNIEIDNLLDKLEMHHSLGFLENKTKEERKKELSDKTGRVLLVALHEATGGKAFEEIILDEYNQIKNEQAKALYLTVAILHRLGSEARAGLISRVHGINFNEFKDKLYSPLEFIVFDEKNHFINDYVYKTRHPYIAEIIFETVLTSEQDRYDEYVRILSYLDIDYKSDLNAFLAMTNARKLLDIFKDPQKVRNLYDIVSENNQNEPKLLQQKAIFEMNSTGGSIVKAEAFLKEAHELIPRDPLISHSLAEASLKKAELSLNKLERNQYLQNAKKLCEDILKRSKDHPYSYHTLLKISLTKLKDVLEENDEPSIETKIKDIEKLLNIVKQLYPDKEFILEIEAKFNEIIDNEPKALTLLEQAYNLNKASPYISLRFAKILERKQNTIGAINVLKQTLELTPNDRDVNYKYAQYISLMYPENENDILHYYRRSFTLGDTRYKAQFWYARALYLFNKFDDSKRIFDALAFARISPDKKHEVRGIKLNEKNIKAVFKGVIIRKEQFYAIVRRDLYGDTIFINRLNSKEFWDIIKVQKNISFHLAFNFKGPLALVTGIL